MIDKLNEGIAKTRNLGISIATGKYIVFLDNDDFIDSDYLQILYDEIKNTGNDIVVAGYRRVSDTKELFKVSPSKLHGQSTQLFHRGPKFIDESLLLIII